MANPWPAGGKDNMNPIERIHKWETGSYEDRCDMMLPLIRSGAWLTIDPKVLTNFDRVAYREAFIRAAQTASWDWKEVVGEDHV